MKELHDSARRTLLRRLALGLTLAPLAESALADAAGTANLPLLSESDPAARATQYVADASKAKGAESGATCANCSLYGAVTKSAGTCSLFPRNLVAAAGWCNAWSGL